MAVAVFLSFFLFAKKALIDRRNNPGNMLREQRERDRKPRLFVSFSTLDEELTTKTYKEKILE